MTLLVVVAAAVVAFVALPSSVITSRVVIKLVLPAIPQIPPNPAPPQSAAVAALRRCCCRPCPCGLCIFFQLTANNLRLFLVGNGLL